MREFLLLNSKNVTTFSESNPKISWFFRNHHLYQLMALNLTVFLSRSVVRSHTEGTEYTDFCKSLRPCWHTSRWFFFPRMSRINTVLRTRVACAGLWDVTIALREKKQFKFCIDSVDNYVIFACCARGVTLSELMLHSLAIVLIIKNQRDTLNLDMF